MEIANMLEKRAEVKRKKPVFGRKDSNKKKRIESDVWRKARGCDNKQRLKKKGHKKTPKSGYRSPAIARGLDKSGLIPVIISAPAQLQGVTKAQGIIVASSTGDKKRRIIIEEALKRGLAIINLDAKKAITKIDAKFTLRKSLKKQEADKKTELEKEMAAKEKEKAEKEKEKEKKAIDEKKDIASKPTQLNAELQTSQEATSKESEMSDEDKKKLEKEEKDRIIIQKK